MAAAALALAACSTVPPFVSTALAAAMPADLSGLPGVDGDFGPDFGEDLGDVMATLGALEILFMTKLTRVSSDDLTIDGSVFIRPEMSSAVIGRGLDRACETGNGQGC